MNKLTPIIYKNLLQWIKKDTVIFFYKSKEWKQTRSFVIKRDNNECQECKRNGKYSKAEMVHHIKELKDYPLLALDTNNLESLCNSCHNKKHPEKILRKEKFENIERW